MNVPPMLPRNRNLLTQNVLSKNFAPHVNQQSPISNQNPTTFSYARRGRGVQGESVNSGSNPMFITSRRKYGGGF